MHDATTTIIIHILIAPLEIGVGEDLGVGGVDRECITGGGGRDAGRESSGALDIDSLLLFDFVQVNSMGFSVGSFEGALIIGLGSFEMV